MQNAEMINETPELFPCRSMTKSRASIPSLSRPKSGSTLYCHLQLQGALRRLRGELHAQEID